MDHGEKKATQRANSETQSLFFVSSWVEYFQLLVPCDQIIIYGRSRSHELLYYFNYLTFVAEPEKSRSKIDGGTFDLDVFKLRKG